MSKLMILSIISILVIYSLLSFHPFNMVILMIMLALVTSIWSAQMISTAWFTYMMIMMMIGGLMVIFIYMASLSANSCKKVLMTPVLIIFYSIMIPITINYIYPMHYMNTPITFMMTNYKFMAFSIFYLFILLTSIMMMNIMKQGPLRSMC